MALKCESTCEMSLAIQTKSQLTGLLGIFLYLNKTGTSIRDIKGNKWLNK